MDRLAPAAVLLALLVATATAQTGHSSSSSSSSNNRNKRLIVVPLSSDSHISAFTALTTELETLGGYEVYMVVADALLDAAKAIATARNPHHSHHFLTYPFRVEMFAEDMAKIAKAHPILAMRLGYKVLSAMVDMVIGEKQLLQQITELQPDLVIGDAVALYGHWLTALLGVPSIEFDVGSSSGLLHSSIWGGQVHPAYLPSSGTFFPSTGMTLHQRCVNLAYTIWTKAMNHIHSQWGPISGLAHRYNVPHMPPRGPSKPLLLLVNFDWALEPPRPVAPNTKYLGALMPRPPAKLPDNILDWLEGRTAEAEAEAVTSTGPKHTCQYADLPVVFVSFGSSFLAPEAAMPAVAAALAATQHKMRFILRMREPEQKLLEAALQQQQVQLQPQQLLVLPQVPQNDLLGHPGIAAFVTQGGYLSVQEAAYHGVPIIGIPLMLGHNELVQHAHDHGRGVYVPKESLMAGHSQQLTQALLAVVTNSSYKEQALITAARVKAHPRSPGQQAADWVAYALAAAPGKGSFLYTQGQDLPWWQPLLLDVLALYAAALVLLGLLMRAVLRSSWR